MSDGQAHITVAICTYNRHSQLRKILPSVVDQQALSSELYRVLIVDNSDDEKARRRFAEEIAGPKHLTVLQSTPAGLSRARNVALDACTTKYIAYLDDDATPKPEWLSALLRAFATHDPAVIAGPIYPVWPGQQPEWLPSKYVGCLTILDHGPKDRWLSGWELAYGANMAFKRELLRQVGGFNVGLGRRGANTLLSEEELEAQLAIRQRGHRIFYAASAGVFHTVHANRLSRNYFRARMSWQAVSALLREPPLPHFDWSLQEIRTAAEKLGLTDSIGRLITYRDADTFSAQLDLIYHLFALLLESKDRDDLAVEKAIAGAPSKQKLSSAPPFRPGRIDPTPTNASAPILASTRHLIVEGQPAHFFLYTLYAELQNSQLQLFPQPIWHGFDEPLAYLQRSVTPNLQTVTFVTLDPLVYGASRRAFNEFLKTTNVRCFGILHRLPENAEQADALREAAVRIAGIMVLAPPLVGRLRETFDVDNVSYLPIHPPYAKYMTRQASGVRTRIGVSPGQTVFSLLGESRKGKGVDVFLEALEHVPQHELKDMFVLMAGRAQHFDRNMIAAALRAKGVAHHIDLRSSDHPLKYAVLSDREFGEYVSVTDVGVVLYQQEQRGCMSGVAPNYVWGLKPLVAFKDSVIGETVLQNDLGIVVEAETAQSVAQALSEALHRAQAGWNPSAAYKSYRAEIAPDAVVARLESILTSNVAPVVSPAAGYAYPRAAHIDFDALPADFAAYVKDLPLLHTWDGGATWNTGGFQPEHLADLYTFLRSTLPSSPSLLETGAGNSTIALLFLRPRRLVSVAPDQALFQRIADYCAAHAIPADALDARVAGSEWVLPQMALELRDAPPPFDFVLIDGCHNWPMVFVDFCYANYLLKPGGLIMVDDVNLHSVKELARMLSEDPGFTLERDLGKSLVFRRISDSRMLNEWTHIPYISRMTQLYSQTRNPFSLGHDVVARGRSFADVAGQ